MITLQGKGALIVGARRVGAVLARRMAQEGINLAIGYRSSASEAESLRDSLSGSGAMAITVQGDLIHEGQVQDMVDRTLATLGNLSFVVNLASDYPRVPLPLLGLGRLGPGDGHGQGQLPAGGARRSRHDPQSRTNARPHRPLCDWAAGETPIASTSLLTAKAAVQFMTRAFAAELAPMAS